MAYRAVGAASGALSELLGDMATTTPAADTQEPRLPYVIYEGDTVICQTSDGRMFFQAVTKDEYVIKSKPV